jgi:hypothetical protein
MNSVVRFAGKVSNAITRTTYRMIKGMCNKNKVPTTENI